MPGITCSCSGFSAPDPEDTPTPSFQDGKGNFTGLLLYERRETNLRIIIFRHFPLILLRTWSRIRIPGTSAQVVPNMTVTFFSIVHRIRDVTGDPFADLLIHCDLFRTLRGQNGASLIIMAGFCARLDPVVTFFPLSMEMEILNEYFPVIPFTT